MGRLPVKRERVRRPAGALNVNSFRGKSVLILQAGFSLAFYHLLYRLSRMLYESKADDSKDVYTENDPIGAFVLCRYVCICV